MDQRWYEIESNGKYAINIKPVAIEDAVGEAYTSQEIEEMFGVYPNSGTQLKKAQIVAELTALKQKMIDENRRSIKITDTELVEVLKNSLCSASNFVKGLRRVGDRLSLHENVAANQKKRYAQVFISMINNCIGYFNRQGQKLELDLKYVHLNRHLALTVIKSLVDLEAMLKDADGRKYYPITAEDAALMREMWADIDQFFEKQVEEDEEKTDQPA